MGRTNEPEPVDFEKLGEAAREAFGPTASERLRMSERATAEANEKLRTIDGWLYWYDNGGSAAKTIAGIRAAVNGDNDEEE